MTYKSLLGIILVGLGFLCLLLSYVTIVNAQNYLLQTTQQDDPSFKGDAFISLCIIATFTAVITLLAPCIINVLGTRKSLLVSALCQLCYNTQFMFPKQWSLYVSSVICGFGGGIMWTAQGRYLTQNSRRENITRHSGIFWGIMQVGRLIGNIYVYCRYQGYYISKPERKELYGILTSICLLGCVFFSMLQQAIYHAKIEINAFQALTATFKLARRKDMLLLIVTFIFCGLQLSFYTGVYSNTLGFAKYYHYRNMKIISLSGLLIAIGEVIGGGVFGIFGQKTVRWGRFPIVVVGCMLNIIACFLIFLNVPNAAAHGFTLDKPIVRGHIGFALFASLLLGFADACYQTQIYGILGLYFREDITQAHAIYRFTQGLATSISYLYSRHIGLYAIVGILCIFSILGTITFAMVELKSNVIPVDENIPMRPRPQASIASMIQDHYFDDEF